MAEPADNARRSSAAVWRIDRFDLIFYNARHRRWQFFAEDSVGTASGSRNRDTGEGLHRFQIRSLLATFRKSVQTVLGSLHVEKRELFELRSDGTAADIPLARPKKSQYWDEHSSTYLEYLIRTAWHDGVPGDHRRNLQDWFKGSRDKVSRAAALTFLSLLPILEEWDTWGCFILARNRSCSRTGSFPPAEAADWTDPLYVAELDFSKPNDADAPSHKLLGYSVEIEGMCLNLGSGDGARHGAMVRHNTPKADFFDPLYCKRPEDEAEVLPYKFYSALVDPIIRRVAGGSDSKRQFVIAYPVNLDGRLQFLQIALSPFKHSNASVDVLWNDWGAVHAELWTTRFKSFRRDELRRIIVTSFQSEVRSHLEERTQYGEMIGEEQSVAELYKHVHHLFPVRSARTEDDTTYAYRKYRFPESAVMLVGDRWEVVTIPDPADRDDCRPIPAAGAKLFVPRASSNTVDELVEEHRIRQAIDQQVEFLKWLPEGLEKSRREAEDSRGRAYQIIVQWAQQRRGRRPTLQDLDEDLEVGTADTGREPFPARYRPWSKVDPIVKTIFCPQ